LTLEIDPGGCFLINVKARKESGDKIVYGDISRFWLIGYFISRVFKKSLVSTPASIGCQIRQRQTKVYAE
jgi:hypothetical protein